MSDLHAAQRDHIFPTYAPPALKFVRGTGAWLETDKGDKYLDFIAGIAVSALGHGHPDMVRAVKEQADGVWHLSNMFDVPGQSELADRYCELSFADRVFFTNSGTESIECALKSARRYHYEQGNEQRATIIGFDGAFHGRSYGAINAAANPNYLKGFGPRLPGYVQVPFGDHDALKAAIDDTTAAIIIEPVQGEGGLRALPDPCLKGLRELCDEHGILLIYDEVQCGAARTGKLFAHQWVEGAEPDIMALAKGVGGGFPFGMCLASEKVAQYMVPGTHGSTYGGNALAMAVGHAVLDHIADTDFLAHVNAMSDHLTAGLLALKDKHHNKIVDVRGKGLLLGFKTSISNLPVRREAMSRGLLVGTAGDNTVRMAPPLIISKSDADAALEILDAAVAAAE